MAMEAWLDASTKTRQHKNATGRIWPTLHRRTYRPGAEIGPPLWYAYTKSYQTRDRRLAPRVAIAQGKSPPALRQIEGREEDRSRASAREGKISRNQRLVKALLFKRAKDCQMMGA